MRSKPKEYVRIAYDFPGGDAPWYWAVLERRDGESDASLLERFKALHPDVENARVDDGTMPVNSRTVLVPTVRRGN